MAKSGGLNSEYKKLYDKYGKSWDNQRYVDELEAITGKKTTTNYINTMNSNLRKQEKQLQLLREGSLNKEAATEVESTNEEVPQVDVVQPKKRRRSRTSITQSPLAANDSALHSGANAAMPGNAVAELDNLLSGTQPMYSLAELQVAVQVVQSFGGDLHKLQAVVDLLLKK